MKKITSIFAAMLLAMTLLSACNTKQPEPEAPQKSFDEMTEEERTQHMIKLIEAEEARMKAAGEL